MDRFGIVVHGGAGDLWPDDELDSARDGAAAAATAGYAVLEQGGSALDAVEAAVIVLENDPNFNAGTGSTLNRDGHVECDASVMESTGRGGAVAAVSTVKNPIRVARKVMEHTPHLLLAGPGAEAFARAQGFPEIANAALVTNRTRGRWKAAQQAPAPAESGGGTVGAVARDAQGRLAAATSTGGTFLKLPGRVGDTPLLGAGTWAQADGGAVSCTGKGEAIILSGLSRWAAEQIALGKDPAQVCREAIDRLEKAGGTGGLIVVSPSGQPALWYDTQRMPFAVRTSTTPLKVGLLLEDRETLRAFGA
jgi:beta-aspartyl-peptidase (threonine type)